MGSLHPHAGGALVPDRQPLLRLEVPVGGRALHEQPPHLPRPRQGARRLELDQRDDLPARQSTRLRALGRRARPRALGLRPLPAVLQAHGDLLCGRRRVARRRRPAAARARPRRRTALRGVLRRGAGGGLSADERRQRFPTGRLRDVRPQHPQGPPRQRGSRVPAAGDEPPESRGAHAYFRRPHRLRGNPRRRRPGEGRDDSGRRGDPLRRRDQLAAAAAALRCRRRG